MINYFKAAERVLSERGRLELALDNLKKRRERVLGRSSPRDISATDYSALYTSGGRANDALNSCLELAELSREIGDTEGMIAEIDSVLGQMERAEAKLLRLWYIDRQSKEEIAAEMAYSSKASVYDMRNRAVAAFAVLYFGAGAIAST